MCDPLAVDVGPPAEVFFGAVAVGGRFVVFVVDRTVRCAVSASSESCSSWVVTPVVNRIRKLLQAYQQDEVNLVQGHLEDDENSDDPSKKANFFLRKDGLYPEAAS